MRRKQVKKKRERDIERERDRERKRIVWMYSSVDGFCEIVADKHEA